MLEETIRIISSCRQEENRTQLPMTSPENQGMINTYIVANPIKLFKAVIYRFSLFLVSKYCISHQLQLSRIKYIKL